MTGICQFCEQTYAALPNGPTDECPGCAEHGACEDCGEAPAGDERDLFKCSACAEKTEGIRSEQAYERMLNDFYGGSSPTAKERFEMDAFNRTRR